LTPKHPVIPASFATLWQHDGPYNDFSRWSRRFFGGRVQKLSVDTGGTCPHRQNGRGDGGCAFCRVDAFVPAYCTPDASLLQQIEAGSIFFGRKYPDLSFLVFFQAYSNGGNIVEQAKLALLRPGVVGVVIAMRSDVVDAKLAVELGNLAEQSFVLVELGLQSGNDKSLRFMNRGHTVQAVYDACDLLAREGVRSAVHLIMGLPGESLDEMLGHARIVNELPVNQLKIHHLQVLEGTAFATVFRENPALFMNWDAQAYAGFCADFLTRLRPDLVIQRFANESPQDLVLHPRWDGIKNFELSRLVEAELWHRHAFQGSVWNGQGA